MTERMTLSDCRILHGVVFVVLTIGVLLIPPVRSWPWLWLVPLGVYFGLVGAASPLRRSLFWIRAGRITPGGVGATFVVIGVTTGVLILFQNLVSPDLRIYESRLPWTTLGNGVLAGMSFALLNAIFEELVFRGILFDALASQWSTRITIFGTAALFALGHLHGYPPGATGACLAFAYGIILGALRAWTGGLILPVIAHIGADATIYMLLTN
jgi:uncharacterized protein